MNDWLQLRNAALLGTDRAPFTPTAGEGPVGALLAHLPPGTHEAALLAAAALYTQYQRAGFRPPQEATPLPQPAPPDDVSPISEQAALHLAQMLDGRFSEALPEWLAQVQAIGQRVRPQWLPRLLTQGAQQPALRLPIVQVIGERGRWLAAWQPGWQYASITPEPSQWEVATGAARLLLLQQIRQTDPAQARALLQSTWQSEKAEDRVAFLTCLEARLSQEDEPFLESCLDDRSKKVQITAVDLLARLPQSQLVGRMIARAQGLLAVKGLLRPAFAITLPNQPDDAWQRDGIQPGKAPAPLQMGEKAWALCQMLACIPPTFWSERWGKSPDALLALAARSEQRQLLFEAWRRATLRHPQQEWAAALIAQGAAAFELVNALPAARREPCITGLVQAKAFSDSAMLFDWLRACQQPWSVAYGRLVIRHVQQHIAKPPPLDRQVWLALSDFARYFPIQLLPEAQAAWRPHAETAVAWQSRLDQFMELLTFRQEMLAALAAA